MDPGIRPGKALTCTNTYTGSCTGPHYWTRDGVPGTGRRTVLSAQTPVPEIGRMPCARVHHAFHVQPSGSLITSISHETTWSIFTFVLQSLPPHPHTPRSIPSRPRPFQFQILLLQTTKPRAKQVSPWAFPETSIPRSCAQDLFCHPRVTWSSSCPITFIKGKRRVCVYQYTLGVAMWVPRPSTWSMSKDPGSNIEINTSIWHWRTRNGQGYLPIRKRILEHRRGNKKAGHASLMDRDGILSFW